MREKQTHILVSPLSLITPPLMTSAGSPQIQGPITIFGVPGAPGEKGQRGEKGDPGVLGGGAVYTRWGWTTCPTDQGNELLYSGRAGGTDHDHNGGAVNFLCLPNDPDHLPYESGVQGESYVAGVDYWFETRQPLASRNHHNAPCAVCYVATRSVVVMIPAKTQCPGNWTVEYVGYLMTEYYNRNTRMMYECVDQEPESIPGLDAIDRPIARFHLVEPYCGGIAFPPYNAEKELACVVCTK